jgi:cation diffusion facilitator CzcD-associated flavoprotein CzcO
VAEHAIRLDDPAELRQAYERLEPGMRVLVVGAGLTGIEAATELAERLPGRKDCLVQFTAADDAPTGRVWTRRLAVFVKEMICSYSDEPLPTNPPSPTVETPRGASPRKGRLIEKVTAAGNVSKAFPGGTGSTAGRLWSLAGYRR